MSLGVNYWDEGWSPVDDEATRDYRENAPPLERPDPSECADYADPLTNWRYVFDARGRGWPMRGDSEDSR